ncbi:pre-mRNA 3'-end-processing factor FIP1 [Epinephelus fuscoguttatus]|uniref:pre-mRNA 3'-end-processing factor FIP1 n=1 Tax=Epinephelus fuscoguttatus TaxID=293821 RepID=UPI0020D0371A|nr:pre-mRNA 3'-end-processing factor FIP1 [Epinephelus fuscoguttatus]
MYSSDSDSPAVCDEDEEGKLYQLVFELGTSNNEDEGKEEVQIPSSSENSPEYQETDDERMYAVGSSNPVECSTVDNTYGLDTDALDNNQAVPVRKEKPWRKPGADITDYFNYGFDEESWNAYCKKHAKARAARKKMYTKIKVQERQTGYEEESCPHSLPGSSPILSSSSESRATLDVIGGRPGSRGRVEGIQCFSDEENISQVITEMSSEEDLSTSHHLPSSSNFSSPFAYTPPPPFLYRPGTPASSAFASSNSQHSKGFDEPSTSQRRLSSGASSLIPRGMASNAGVINTAKAWERYIWQEKCDTARDRSRDGEHSCDEDSHRDRDRERRSSTHSGEERTRRRDTTERGHKHHSLARSSGEKKDKRHRERRHGDNNEGGSSRKERKNGGEEGESQSRKKRKRARKKRKEKETNKMSSADQERKLKSD